MLSRKSAVKFGPTGFRARHRERRLLALVAVITLLGVSLSGRSGFDPWYQGLLLGGSLAIGLFCLHCLFCFTGFSGDEILLPLCGFLCALGLTVLAGISPSLAFRQLRWILLGLALVPLGALPRQWESLANYRYVVGITGLGLLFVTALFGVEQWGARLWLEIGSVRFQPGEVVRLGLGVFIAGILSENSQLFAHPTARLGPFSIPEPRHLMPLVSMWVLFLFVLVVQRDLGSAVLYYALFALLSYAATGQIVYLVVPALMGGLGGVLAALVFPHVATRFKIWLKPWASPRGAGYQIVQTMFALANGGWLGKGLGQGLARAIPASHTDLPLAVIGEELGFAGILACLTAEFLLAAKGLAISFRCSHGFLRLLALAVVLGWSLSIFLVAGGLLRLVPLTGLVTPFISYGGTAMVTNLFSFGLLLNISRQEIWS
ncbi:MAG: FtsW/RodA/SpoVE family cell cycle protein [Firmicutes bacterium]|nr:FtsW/RodA/SpoVE family cell cycle protein [Bacillota bacterium]